MLSWYSDLLKCMKCFSADPQFQSAVINTNVIVSYTGEVVWLSHGIYRSSCDINVEYFPFDLQSCQMKWASWTYDGYQVSGPFPECNCETHFRFSFICHVFNRTYRTRLQKALIRRKILEMSPIEKKIVENVPHSRHSIHTRRYPWRFWNNRLNMRKYSRICVSYKLSLPPHFHNQFSINYGHDSLPSSKWELFFPKIRRRKGLTWTKFNILIRIKVLNG